MELMDRLTFTKPFQQHSPASVEAIARSITNLDRQRQGWERSSCLASAHQIKPGYYQFEVWMLRRNRTWDYGSAKAYGVIECDTETGKTRVTAKVGFAGFHYIITLLFPFIVLAIVVTGAFDIPRGSEWLMLAAGFGITLYLWNTLFSDRDTLIENLNTALYKA